jgi:uncharacterized protein (DUF1800 family)
VRGERPALKQPPRGEFTQPLSAARSSRRSWLSAFTGGALNPLGPSGSGDAAPRQDPVLTLVHRITQGFSLAEYERAKTLGYEAYLEEQLDHLAIDDAAMDERLLDFPTLGLSPKQLYDTYNADFTTPYYEFKGAALLRAVHSKRQLFERMVEFWNDYFCIDQNKGNLEWVFLPEHDRDVIRAHALGSFPAMLSACAHGAAMLHYLDNWLNVAGSPQMNYARELLELHTLGVHGGYNEFDVEQVARCFTGWTLNLDTNSPDYLRSRFVLQLHAGGSKVVLGSTIEGMPAAIGGHGNSTPAREAQRVLDIAVAHPSTADFLVRRLIRRFLTPTPPDELVAEAVEAFTSSHGDIPAVLRVILARKNLLWSSSSLGRKFRRPFHYMVSLLRAFEADVRHPNDSLLFYLPGMGHMPFDHVQPDGYPDTIETWGTSLLPRWSFASQLLRPGSGLSHAIAGVNMPSFPELKARLDFHGESDRPGLAERMNTRLFGAMLPPHEESTLQQYIDAYAGTFDILALFDCLSLAASLPGFQWY